MELESISDQRRPHEQELADSRGELAEMRRALDRERSEFSRLKARRDSLEEILSHRAYTTESVKRLFTAIERGQAQGCARWACWPISWRSTRPTRRRPRSSCTTSWNTWWWDWRQAEWGIELLRASVEGRATFLVHPEPAGEPASGRLARASPGRGGGHAARLSEVLRLTNGFGSYDVQCLPRLARCFLAKDRAAAQRLALEYPDLYFLLPDGVCYHGHAVSGGKKTSSGPLALKRELREVKRRCRCARSASRKPPRAARASSATSRAWSRKPNACVAPSRARRKKRWPWITKCASWPTSFLEPVRGSPWRASSWTAWPRSASAPWRGAAATRPWWKRRSAPGPSTSTRSRPRARIWTD